LTGIRSIPVVREPKVPTWPDTEGIQLGGYTTRPEGKAFQLFNFHMDFELLGILKSKRKHMNELSHRFLE
jgi:hypothetical protein